jgi:hypothetical protein
MQRLGDRTASHGQFLGERALDEPLSGRVATLDDPLAQHAGDLLARGFGGVGHTRGFTGPAAS